MARERDEPSIPSFACPHCGGLVPATTVVIHKGDGHQSGPDAKSKIDKRTQIFGFRIFPRNETGLATLILLAITTAGISFWQLSENLLDSGKELIGTNDAGDVGRILFRSALVCGPLLLLSLFSAFIAIFGVYSSALSAAENIARLLVESDRASRKRARIFLSRLREESLDDETMTDDTKERKENRIAWIVAQRSCYDAECNRHGRISRFFRNSWVSFFADEDVIALRDAKVSDDEDDDGGWS